MKPGKDEYAPFYETYVSKVTAVNALEALEQSLDEALLFFQELPEAKENHRYQPEKWSVKELLQHVIDTERIMAYRALCIARMDKTELPGFDENAYVEALNMQERRLGELFEEYLNQRKASISLYKSFGKEDMAREGIASKQAVSVRALGYIIAGHQTHHFQIVKERYL